MTDADAEAEVVIFAVAVVDAACDVLPAAWLLLVDDVHPAIDNEATITSTVITNNFFIIYVPPMKNESKKNVMHVGKRA